MQKLWKKASRLALSSPRQTRAVVPRVFMDSIVCMLATFTGDIRFQPNGAVDIRGDWQTLLKMSKAIVLYINIYRIYIIYYMYMYMYYDV